MLSKMHEEMGTVCGPFKENSIMNHFMNHISTKEYFTKCDTERDIDRQLKAYHRRFILSLAGQSVATYVLGIRDRHPSNYML